MRRESGNPQGKLEKLARTWASGRATKQAEKNSAEFLKDCERFGLDPSEAGWKDEHDNESVIIWPDMRDSVAIFFSLTTQWRWTAAGMAGAFRTGLDYNAIEPSARAAGIEMTPQIFDDIRTLERETLTVWSRKRG